MKKLLGLMVMMILLPLQSTQAGDAFELPSKVDLEGFDRVMTKTGSVYLAGQPTEDVLQWAKANGVTTVINLRSDAEMEKHTASAFDEAALLAEMGLSYVHIPLGGKKHPYTEASVEAFAEAMQAAGHQNVLVHCASSGRVSYMWAAWLAKHLGFPVEKAVEHARAVGFGKLPLERLLGTELVISSKPE